jgi:hypothetical protein
MLKWWLPYVTSVHVAEEFTTEYGMPENVQIWQNFKMCINNEL